MTWWMTVKPPPNYDCDSWAITLRCPHCGRAGTAIVSEVDSVGKEARLRIGGLSSGFVVVPRRAAGAPLHHYAVLAHYAKCC